MRNLQSNVIQVQTVYLAWVLPNLNLIFRLSFQFSLRNSRKALIQPSTRLRVLFYFARIWTESLSLTRVFEFPGNRFQTPLAKMSERFRNIRKAFEITSVKYGQVRESLRICVCNEQKDQKCWPGMSVVFFYHFVEDLPWSKNRIPETVSKIYSGHTLFLWEHWNLWSIFFVLQFLGLPMIDAFINE